MNVIVNSNTLLTLLNLVMTIAVVLGGIFAFKVGMSKTASEIQERVISALRTEIQSLQDRISQLEKENTRLQQILGIIKSALKKRGLTITIDSDLVSIHDEKSGNTTQSSRITGSSTVET